MLVKPGITADGFRVAVRDYTEYTVVEELAANSYDADASTLVVLLDCNQGQLHVIDDGIGFSREAFERMAVLGAGQKQAIPYSKGKRHYLGSYGFGLKSTLNVANTLRVESHSDEGCFLVTIDWTRLEDMLKGEHGGFSVEDKIKRRGSSTGTQYPTLSLKNPTTRDHLEKFAAVLSNLPEDGGAFKCFYGDYSVVAKDFRGIDGNFGQLPSLAKRLVRAKKLSQVDASFSADLWSMRTDRPNRQKR